MVDEGPQFDPQIKQLHINKHLVNKHFSLESREYNILQVDFVNISLY